MTSLPPEPLHDERLPLYHRIRDTLHAEIAAHKWRPGEPLPTEAELAKSHGASIGTVRKAVDSLVAAGVVERLQGKGTFIRRPDFQSSLFRFFRFVDRDGALRAPGLAFKEPVLVNLLDGSVHPLPAPKDENGTVVFADLPLFDFPLVIVERAGVALSASRTAPDDDSIPSLSLR